MEDLTLASRHQCLTYMPIIELQPASASESDGFLNNAISLQDEPRYRSRCYIICLVLGTAGVQVAFSIQFSTGISYFESLGITKSVSTLIWFVPPVCGAFLQPLFGRWSDKFRKRKPFISFGGVGLVIALIGYAWSPELAELFPGRSQPHKPAPAAAPLALFFFVVLNVSVQPVQSGLRALVVDKCHASQQTETNAWASRVNHVASMISYLAATTDLAGRFPVASTQIQALVVLSIIVIIASLVVTCCTVAESPNIDLASERGVASADAGATWRLLSSRLRRIYLAQFFSWFAWFPLLVQITSFIITMNCPLTPPSRMPDVGRKCEAAGGASALFSQSCVALLMAFILPVLTSRASSTWGKLKHFSNHGRAGSEHNVLQALWFASQMLFAALVSTVFYESRLLTILSVALTGICWCVTQWVPFVLANEEVIKIEESRRLAGMESCTGALLGAHNTFIALPQILATGASSLLFEMLKAIGLSDPLGDVLWVFSMSVCMSLISAYLLWRL
ncbi:MFS general substrate transporter [Didymella exigua CBS 183.55]|uniref:MFS general substrate transporter n=1 Tax=Didymella exigua CBS 183.55 TaxID=1150837 RepID=A0A6A5S3D9_9PLEO|nr:MFS general substrate transporter [Didymella exigua CBS 183.55]KAF1934463.1 MFS general substrate transporter [Didymella exigua CBS 183.55]